MLVVDLWSVMIMVLAVRKLVSWLILPVIAILSFSAGVFAADTVRIMPLGDSITRGWYGSDYSWGYRKPLYDSLTGGGYDFDFVGSKANGSFPDPNHEGRDGWRADEILNGRTSEPAEGKLEYWLPANQPDVILLHIGTNDITAGNQGANEVNDILDVIDDYEDANDKHVTVILALIINRNPYNYATTQFNRDVNNMALNRIASGDDIVIVDMESALNYSTDMNWDGLHPNDSGYAKMATVWYNALVDYFSRVDCTIYGYVVELDGNTPVEGVLIQTDDNDINSVTDANGYYELMADYGWSGTATPTKEGYTFEPNSRYYEDVNRDYTADQNYTGNKLDFRITGYIKNECNVPIGGVLVDANNGGDKNITDVNGCYEVWVDYKWSGTVTPSKNHYTFEPNSMSYANVLGDIADQNYVANNIYDLDCDGTIGYGDVAVISENWLQTEEGIPGDFYKDETNTVNFLDFADFANVWGD
jgi:lysophospholipase L1-like esterase